MWNYVKTHPWDLLRALVEHIDLTFASLIVATLIALPLGYLIARRRGLANIVQTGFGALYTVPSLALFALLVPIVGLGFGTALIALVLYAQYGLIRNIALGFRSIDAGALEAARGMGLSPWEVLLQVELPLAAPLILGGLRLAAVGTVGIATIAAWINAGGLGVILFEGLAQNQLAKIGAGTIVVAALALTLNQVLGSLEQEALARAKGEA